jgi:hypothetical protein
MFNFAILNCCSCFSYCICKYIYKKIKVVDLNELYNFVVDDFFSWNHLLFPNIV